MNESSWNPSPGDRVLIRNAGEYGWGGLSELNVMVHHNQGNRPAELVRVFDALSTGRPVTVLRSDLSPVEPPRPPVPSLEWFDPDDYPEPKDIAPLVAMGLRSCPTCRRPFERHTGPETEETRRLTKEDFDITPFSLAEPFIGGTDDLRLVAGGLYPTKEDYSDVEVTRKSVLFDEMVAELIETVSAKLAESYRARTRKEGTDGD